MKDKNHLRHHLSHLIVIVILGSFLTTLSATAAPSVFASISALKGNAKKGKDVYYTCALCHTPEGWGTVDGYYPQLSGQHPNVLLKQLIDIKVGNREVPTMIPFADDIFHQGHKEVADVISYIASLPMTPSNSVGVGDDLKKGKNLYTSLCQSCHGVNAEGNNEKGYPLIQGQHYEYIFRQILWIQEGLRKNGDEKMRLSVAEFSDADIRAVSDYISRIKPDNNKVAESSNWQNPDFHGGFVDVPENAKNKNQK